MNTWPPLSPTMESELRSVLNERPNSVHEEDRVPFEWTRGTPRRTALALQRRGIVDRFYQRFHRELQVPPDHDGPGHSPPVENEGEVTA